MQQTSIVFYSKSVGGDAGVEGWCLNFLTVSWAWTRRQHCGQTQGPRKNHSPHLPSPAPGSFTSRLNSLFITHTLFSHSLCFKYSYLPYHLLLNLPNVLKSHTILILLLHNVRTIKVLGKLSWSSATWSFLMDYSESNIYFPLSLSVSYQYYIKTANYSISKSLYYKNVLE